MPRSRPVSLNVFGTRASISGTSGARLARIGTTIVEGSGACARRGAAHATIIRKGNNARPKRALHAAIMSDTTTRGIRIEIESEYLPDQSNRETYTFAYHVRISNTAKRPHNW